MPRRHASASRNVTGTAAAQHAHDPAADYTT
jgi:hypothetical protein